VGIAVVAAPSNLGLRPPVPTASPGCAKAPEALRAAGLRARLGARDAGVVLPRRYVDDYVPGSGRVRNQEAILEHSTRLATSLGLLLDAGAAPLVVGGDCSILLGVGLALRPRGRFGLVHIDGHTDFRHPGNSESCASLAGEDLAAAIGRHWPAIARLGGEPHFDEHDVVHLGCRDDDEHLAEVRGALPLVIPAAAATGAIPAAAAAILPVVNRAELSGYWLHLDVDVLDPSVMPAVDSPAPGGLTPADLTALLRVLAPPATGAHVTVFDPDLDPGGDYARLLADCLAEGLSGLGSGCRAGTEQVGRDG
jgi:arginase